jgi:carbon-monoxide dehydrogenase large subunit
LFGAKKLGRPIKYSGDRSEMFLADSHGRDNLTTVTAGFGIEGHLQAMLVETTANLGAYCTAVGPFVPTMAGGRVVGTVYNIPLVAHSVQTVFTNTMPVAAYRGAGRPEACYVMERLLEQAAVDLALDPVEIRHRNFVSSEDFPYTMPSGVELTGGEFSETLKLGLERADWQGFASRFDSSKSRGLLRGRGIGYYVESSGGGPEEEAKVTANEDGSVDVVVGTFSHGQGHRTTFSQVLAERLGVDFDLINIIQGDTREVKFGGGTGGSRSSQMGSIAILRTAEVVLEDAQDIAAQLLQVERSTLSYGQGRFSTSEHQATATLADVGRAATELTGGKLTATHRYNRGGGFTFPNGCHIAEVEIDSETGHVEVARYTAVDDCGRVINPLLAAGQVHGGVAMGIGQALLEHAVYDADGQLLTGSLMDYTLPRASQLPDMTVSFNEVLDPNNELGVKGIGEGGACGAPSAVVNAVLNALAPYDVETIDMPITAEKVWRAINSS